MSRTNIPGVLKPNVFILVNPTDEVLWPAAFGQPIAVPPRDEVARVASGTIYRYPAAADARGRPIPGTVVIQDEVHLQPGGPRKVVFDALGWVQMLDANNEPLFNRGLAVVLSPDQVAEAKRVGRAKYELSIEERDHQILLTERARQMKIRERGEVPFEAPNEADIRAAMERESARRKARPAINLAEIDAALGIVDEAQPRAGTGKSAEGERDPAPQAKSDPGAQGADKR